MKIFRRFTRNDAPVIDQIEWKTVDVKTTNPDGSIVFEQKDVEVPAHWSDRAAEILAKMYFRKTGVPKNLIPIAAKFEPYFPEWLYPKMNKFEDHEYTTSETSAKQVFARLAGCWTYWGVKKGYFDHNNAQIFYDEIFWMLAQQMAAPNSPQWFNTGLHWAYGILGDANGQWAFNSDGEIFETTNSYERPQVHACQPSWALISSPEGLIRIAELREGDKVFDRSGITIVKAKIKTGLKEVFQVHIANGNYIEATGEHKVLVCKNYNNNNKRNPDTEWMRVDDIRPGMRLLQINNIARSSRLDVNTSEATLVGFLQGDGYQSRSYFSSPCIEFMSINQEEHELILSCIHDIFDNAHYNITEVDNDSNLDIKRIRLYGKNLIPFLDRNGIFDDTWAENMRVPECILRSDPSISSAYLRSFFQAEGCVRLKKNNSSDIIVMSISKLLLEDIQRLLLNLGIYSRISPSYEKRDNRKPCYALIIAYKSEREKFYTKIGFVARDKQTKLINSLSLEGKDMPKERWEEVTEITSIGEYDVYDIETESHNYLTNNIVVHNCYIQPISDDLVNSGGIMDLWTREAKLFKFGSGTGTNFSNIRGKDESLKGGGKSSGLMSFLKIGDQAAGAIKSGGTTRRAAKMVCLDLDHPEIEDFVEWKMREERKALAMYEGSKLLAERDGGPIYSIGWEGEAINTISGQNSNNSIRITDEFLRCVDDDKDWDLINRTDGKIHKTIKARELWQKICRAAWASADPGVQFHDTINRWHTCANDGKINASNPCGEYNFVDNTACNLASLNLVKFLNPDNSFNISKFEHATWLWTIVLDISVSMANYPSREIAKGSWKYRTLGLGYANLGGLLMRKGLSYDSLAGRRLAAAITNLMHATSLHCSNDLARELGAFPQFEANRNQFKNVLNMHHIASQNRTGVLEADQISHIANHNHYGLIKQNKDGFRNAQVTLLAPTGTISYLMDCDTTGIEPEFALVKTKLLAGGGTFEKIVNPAIESALAALGYKPHEINLIKTHIISGGAIEDCKFLNSMHMDVFLCSNPQKAGGRCLRPEAHVLMVAAVQPFLSGAVSKTTNLPNSATVEDVDKIYRLAHKLGVKAVALYRDGSKLTQPLNVVKTETEQPSKAEVKQSELKGEVLARSARERLPWKRNGYTHKVRIDGQTLYLRTGEYPDGRLGEIFLTSSKEGSTARAYIEGFAKAISLALQFGVPLQEFIDAFTHVRFEPAGLVEGHENIKQVSSIFDFVFRDLAINYLKQEEHANVRPIIDPYPTLVQSVSHPDIYYPKQPESINSGETCKTCGGNLKFVGTCKCCDSCGEQYGGCG